MTALPLWGAIETPDGLVVPGPHGVSAIATRQPGTSSTVCLVQSGGEALLIDSGRRTTPGYPPGVLNTICDILDERKLNLKYILQTHFHYDHVGNTQYLADRYDATVCAHPDEQSILEDPLSLTRPAYIESMGGDPRRIAQELSLEDPAALLPSPDSVEQRQTPAIEVDRTIDQGDILAIGELELEVIHTPGHTRGHLSLYNPSTKCLYLGDVGYWPTPLHPHPVGRIVDQRESITKCLKRETRYLFPGHGLPRCGRDAVTEFLRDLRLRQQQLGHRLLILLSRYGPLTVPDLFAETFPIKIREDYATDGWYGNGLNCIHAHLRRLLDAGDVQRVVRDDIFAWDVTDASRLSDRKIGIEGGYDRLRTLTALDAN